MPGFLGGSSGSSSTGGEIQFPKEFIDPVTKLRVSNPENLIDTDFEYGLQPTKWETVELINNTPSFFSKSGDTTIPGIVAITTNAGTREITVVTALDHNLAAGIPIQVTGTKSITADGSYIINSIPNATTFTYLCKDDQATTSSIEDLYSSIITGEFFQGSQLRISDSSGVITDGEGVSTLTVKTESTHGFGTRTPFYFLNLNSTISQEFQAANTAAKSFDASNSATAQTFDGSNTLSSTPVDWSNNASIGGTDSTISGTSTTANTITVAHGTENFSGLPLGTPLYYSVTPAVGYFLTNPRGVVFLKGVNQLGTSTSTFTVSEVPDGEVIPIESSLSGFFKVANQARTFSGNNIDLLTQQSFSIIRDEEKPFEGANDGGPSTEGFFSNGNPLCTVTGYSGSLINVSVTAAAGLGYYTGAMVLYSTTGSAASGLTNNTTYFIDSFFSTGTNTFAFTIKALPTDTSPINVSGGTGTQTFARIGVSLDKNIWHIRDAGYAVGDLLEYSFPEDGEVVSSTAKTFLFVDVAYDTHNYILKDELFSITTATGGDVVSDITLPSGAGYRVHTFTTVGSTNFVVSALGTLPTVEYLIIGGGGAGGPRHGGGGGAGGFLSGSRTLTVGTFPVVVGAGGQGRFNDVRGLNGANSSAFGLSAIGGGGGGSWGDRNGASGGSGGGGSEVSPGVGGDGTAGQGFAGAISQQNGTGHGSGGGGAAGIGTRGVDSIAGPGGPGRSSRILGPTYFFAGGGGAGSWESGAVNVRRGGNGGIGGGGGGGQARSGTAGTGGGSALNPGGNGTVGVPNATGGDGGANTGGGGGGGGAYPPNVEYGSTRGGNGGSGIVVLRYPTTPVPPLVPPIVSGGVTTDATVDGFVYRTHAFTTVGASTLSVTEPGSYNQFEILVVAGGGGGGGAYGAAGGGGAGGLVYLENRTLNVGNYNVTVGAGGIGGTTHTGDHTSVSTQHGRPGGNSVFDNITALGGGGGNMAFYAPSQAIWINGGSGGGGGDYYEPFGANWIGGQATQTNSGGGIGYGNPGGSRGPSGPTVNEDGAHGQPHEGAGGGGAGGVPTGGNSGAPSNGGIGLQFSQFAPYGSPAGWFAGGGGGGQHYQALGTQTNTNVGGFFGGGGLGADERAQNNGSGSRGSTAGAANTGGGGGGGARNYGGGATGPAANGGSGIVLIRYPIAIAS
jgi:hypothetical protein